MKRAAQRFGLWNMIVVLLLSFAANILFAAQSSAAPTPITALSSIFNFRDMSSSGYVKAGLLYRSSQLCQRDGNKKTNKQLSAADQTKLAGALEGGAIIDLRDRGTDNPQEWKDCPDPNLSNVRKVSTPVKGVGSVSGYANTFAGKEKVNEKNGVPSGKTSRTNLGKALETIADSDGPVLFHCTYGKDRTGWIAAMVLYIVGADYNTIKADYMKSNNDLPSGKKVDVSWLEAALQQVNKSMTGADGMPSRATVLKYLTAQPADTGGGLGVSQSTIDKIKSKLSNGKTADEDSGINLTIGSYNVLGWYHHDDGPGKFYPGDNSKGFSSKHVDYIVKNIKSMGMNIVGLQEYRDAPGGKNQILDALGGSWKAIGPGDQQLIILYDSSVVSLVKNDYQKGIVSREGCEGGDPAAHYAKFTINSNGQEFLVVNFHPPVSKGTKCNNVRLNIVKTALSKSFAANYSGPMFVIGDFNSAMIDRNGSSNNIYEYLISAGYKNSIETAQQAIRNKATIGDSSDWKRSIDFIYYKNIGAPSSYETLDCTSKDTCGSDHRPVKATFGSGGSSGECGGDQKQVLDSGSKYYNVNPCICAAGPSGDSSLSGETLAEQAFSFFVTTSVESNDGKPLNAAQAAGIVGNLMIETAGGSYDLKPDSVNSIGASGIAQWLGGRKTALDTFANEKEAERKKNNKGGAEITWKDFRTQLEFVVHELENGYKGAVMNGDPKSSKTVDKGLKNITDLTIDGAGDAADIVARYYEIPSISDTYLNRREAAAKAFNDFKDNAPGGGGLANCGSDGDSSGDVTSIGDIAFPLAIKYGDITTSGSAWTHTYHENTCTYYYALDIMINMKNGTKLAKTVPVIAMHDGKVTTAKQGLAGYGRTVIIHGSDGLNYAALHVDKMKVSRGQAVKKGDTIGIGVVNANGYHVHVDLSNGSSRPSACASCSPKICPAKGRFLPELRPKLKEIYESMKDKS